MIFLTDSDFDNVIRSQILNQITDYTPAILDSIELTVIEEMQSYLKLRDYDVAAIFAATTTDRNPIIVMYAVDIVLYHIISRLAPNKITDVRITRYETAMKWLKMVSSGELIPNLPKVDPPASLEGYTSRFGEIKRTNSY